MAYWLLKSEPEEFSFAEQVARGASGEPWTGVRNHQAAGFLKAMAVSDLALFYHTGSEKQAVGIVEVMAAAYPEPDAPGWVCVDVIARQRLARPVTLAEVKGDRLLRDMVLARNPRLSVQPVTAGEWERVLELAGGTMEA
jgi:predicted RNA-binding protein with PUA-like domain